MRQKILLLAFCLTISISPSDARSIREDEGCIGPQRMSKFLPRRLANPHDVKTFFQSRKSDPLQALKRTEAYYNIPTNLDKIKSLKGGEVYKIYIDNRQPLKDIFGQTPETQSSRNFSSIDLNRNNSQKDVGTIEKHLGLNSSDSLKTEEDKDVYRLERACELYEALRTQRFSGFFEVFSNKKEASLYGWRFDLLLGTVLQQFIIDTRLQNGHGYVYKLLPDFIA